MSNTETLERRIHPRYFTRDEQWARFLYDVDAPVEYRLVEEATDRPLSDVRHGTIKNLSVEGLCLMTEDLLFNGENVKLCVSLPKTNESVNMAGIVRWVSGIPSVQKSSSCYDVGVQLVKVNDKLVQDTVYFDQQYSVGWSIVLESVLGRFRIIMQQKN